MSTITILISIFAVLFLAFSNGANDNFKGVATLFGSRTTNYKMALTWATITTLAGSCVALFLAQKLMVHFSGKGLVPEAVIQMSSFSLSVAASAATTVFLATRFGFPISTTHGITGALVGAGFIAAPGSVDFEKLGSVFLLPLLISPFLAIFGALFVYPIMSGVRKKLNVNRETCICLGKEILAVSPQGLQVGSSTEAFLKLAEFPQLKIGTQVTCEQRYVGKAFGINAKTVLDTLHFLSAGTVCFARGLNDTPKIAAILMIGGALSLGPSLWLVAIAMAAGGIIMARRIAHTMAFEITGMNDGQGFTANLVTSVIVLLATPLGMPVSTTHVACGALFGIGAVTKKANWSSIIKIVSSWVITLPVSAGLGALFMGLFSW